MKPVLIAAALTACLTALPSPGAAQREISATPVANAPVLILEQTSHSAGEVLKGEAVVAEFEFRNAGKANLRILSVKPACGCTTPDYDEVVPPGGNGRILLRVETERFAAGSLKKTATVTTNDPAQDRLLLTVEATVTTLVDVLPRDVATFRHFRGEKQPQTLTIRSQAESPFAIERVTVSDDIVRHRLRPKHAASTDRPASWELDLWIDEDAPIGPFKEEVQLLTNSVRSPVVPITVRGFVLGNVDVTPASVYFRVDRNESAEKELTVSHRKGADFVVKSSTLRAAKIGAEAIEIDTEVLREDAVHRVIVRYAGGLAPGNYSGKVVLGTSDDDEPTVEVPLYLVVS